jgi:hypothetical protein
VVYRKTIPATIIIPKNYEGLVVIEYDRPDGQPKVWTGGFFGIGASRVIKTDDKGHAKTQFKYFDRSMPLLDDPDNIDDLEGMHIFFENDLRKEIPLYWSNDDQGTEDTIYKAYKKYNLPLAFYTEPSIVTNELIITSPNSYGKYFLDEKEKNINDFSNQLKDEYLQKIDNLTKP